MTEELKKEIRAKGGRIFPMTPVVLYITDLQEYYRRYHLRKKSPLNRAQAISSIAHRILQITGTNKMSFPDQAKLRAFVYGVYAKDFLTDKESQKTWEFLKKQNAVEGVYKVLNKYFQDFSLKDAVETEADFLFALDEKNFIESRFDQIKKADGDYCVVDFKFNTPLPERSPSTFVMIELLIQEIGFIYTREVKPAMILHDLSQSKCFAMDSAKVNKQRFLDMLLLAAKGIKGKNFFPAQMALEGFENPWQEANSILKELDLNRTISWQEKNQQQEKKTEALLCGDHLQVMTYDVSRHVWLCPQCSY